VVVSLCSEVPETFDGCRSTGLSGLLVIATLEGRDGGLTDEGNVPARFFPVGGLLPPLDPLDARADIGEGMESIKSVFKI